MKLYRFVPVRHNRDRRPARFEIFANPVSGGEIAATPRCVALFDQPLDLFDR